MARKYFEIAGAEDERLFGSKKNLRLKRAVDLGLFDADPEKIGRKKKPHLNKVPLGVDPPE
jgi:hypothetical protein